MKKLVLIIAGLSVLACAGVFAADIGDISLALKSAKRGINFTLTELGTDIAAAAKKLGGTDLKGADARKVLSDLCKYRPYVINCSILNADGVKITVEPVEYQQYEGADRTVLPYVIKLLKTRKPVMSDVYHSAEGIHAFTIAYPIFSGKGDFLGAVRMLIRYELFLKPLAEDKPCKIWIMQQSGLIVYDADPEEIGKNIFTDDMFKPFDDLIAFSKTVALSRSGAGSYSFYVNGLKDKTLASKVAAWDTVGLYGTEWRVVAIDIEKTFSKPSEPDKKAQ